MRDQLQNNRSAEIFSHQLLEIWNGTVPVDPTSGRISLPHNFCNLLKLKELVEKVYLIVPIFKPIIRITIGCVNERNSSLRAVTRLSSLSPGYRSIPECQIANGSTLNIEIP